MKFGVLYDRYAAQLYRYAHAQFALRADRLDLSDRPEVAYQVTLRVDDVLSRRRPAAGTNSVTASP
ncbi:hypothetical protein GCM10023176_14570 [Micromonospora coerulea]|uniref:Uncharacterized protein n=1 Tax=Micromonospora coerulea TaxID=47856 RepID=A0ABP8SD37_9ACTN